MAQFKFLTTVGKSTTNQGPFHFTSKQSADCFILSQSICNIQPSQDQKVETIKTACVSKKSKGCNK